MFCKGNPCSSPFFQPGCVGTGKLARQVLSPAWSIPWHQHLQLERELWQITLLLWQCQRHDVGTLLFIKRRDNGSKAQKLSGMRSFPCASNLSHEIHAWSLLQCFFFFFATISVVMKSLETLGIRPLLYCPLGQSKGWCLLKGGALRSTLEGVWLPNREETMSLVVLKPKMTYPCLTLCGRDLSLYFCVYEVNLI